MARIRTIKPDFFTDENIADLSPFARLLFIGMFCHADRKGVLEYRPKRLKVQILAYDSVNIEELINEIHSIGKIYRYIIGSKNFIQIKGFQRHQRPHHTEKDSDLPEYNGEETVVSPCKDGEEKEGKERKGKERKGKERDSSEQTNVCSEQAAVSILLKSGETADFTVDQITETAKSFPRLSFDDVKNELLKCALWNKDNPKRRKTEAGIGRHVSRWLSKADENRSGKTQTNEAAQAWDSVMEQISAVGKGGEPNISAKARKAVDELFGGWMPMCNRPQRDLEFARAKFINLYNEQGG